MEELLIPLIDPAKGFVLVGFFWGGVWSFKLLLVSVGLSGSLHTPTTRTFGRVRTALTSQIRERHGLVTSRAKELLILTKKKRAKYAARTVQSAGGTTLIPNL